MPINSNQVVIDVLQEFPMNEDQVPKNFLDITSQDIWEYVEANLVEDNVVDDSLSSRDERKDNELFFNVLLELDRLKERLGGESYYQGQAPTIDDPDSNKVIFGVPMPAVKDWLRMTLKNEWIPRFFLA